MTINNITITKGDSFIGYKETNNGKTISVERATVTSINSTHIMFSLYSASEILIKIEDLKNDTQKQTQCFYAGKNEWNILLKPYDSITDFLGINL